MKMRIYNKVPAVKELIGGKVRILEISRKKSTNINSVQKVDSDRITV